MSTWHVLFLAPWVIFALWWAARALGTARTVERESVASRLIYGVPLSLSIVLLSNRLDIDVLTTRAWERSFVIAAVGLALEWGGLAFTIWARETLGRLWSGNITLKEEHRIVKSGPYRLVRHPIYTGLLTMALGLALAHADLAALLGFVLATAALRRKITLEERLLVRHFGADYEAYRREVRALIPFVLVFW